VNAPNREWKSTSRRREKKDSLASEDGRGRGGSEVDDLRRRIVVWSLNGVIDVLGVG